MMAVAVVVHLLDLAAPAEVGAMHATGHLRAQAACIDLQAAHHTLQKPLVPAAAKLGHVREICMGDICTCSVPPTWYAVQRQLFPVTSRLLKGAVVDAMEPGVDALEPERPGSMAPLPKAGSRKARQRR